MCLLLSLSLISCSSTTVTGIDAALTVACDKALLEGKTWRDLATAFVRRGAAIDDCNARLKLIRNVEQ